MPILFFCPTLSQKKIQANIDEIYDRFVHFGNVPEDGLQCVLCVGHQFGKVDRYVFISNKNKVIEPCILIACSFYLAFCVEASINIVQSPSRSIRA